MGNYERIRRQFYDDTHVVLICFDISNQDSLDNVEHMVSDVYHELPRTFTYTSSSGTWRQTTIFETYLRY